MDRGPPLVTVNIIIVLKLVADSLRFYHDRN